jgi:CelD/BcsL family acetyltransferase involved in cellulose biosynthesis
VSASGARTRHTGSDRLTVIAIDPVTDPRWLALSSRPPAGLFHSAEWLGVLSDAYGLAPRAYVVTDADGAPRGGLVFCEVADALGPRLVALPFSDTCDPLLESADAWRAIFPRLEAHQVPIRLRCLDDRIATADERLTVAKRARWHTLDVAAGPDALWDGLAAPTRRAIRKAERAEVTIRPLAGIADLREFHRLHVALRKRKYRLLAQPPEFFAAIERRFSATRGWLPLGAFLGERLIAATIYLRWGDTLYYKFNASDPDALAARPNDLLVWAGIELAHRMGCRALDLGPSDDDQPGLIRFKRGFGAAERELRFLSHEPAGWRSESGAETRRLLGDLTGLLTAPDVPDEVTARAGAFLYRLFA